MQSQPIPIQTTSEPIKNQQVPVYSQETSNENPFTNQILSVPIQKNSQQLIQDKQGNSECTNTSTNWIEPVATEQNQIRTPHIHQVQNSHNLII